MLILDFFNTTYRTQRLLGKSPRTVKLYRFTVKAFSQSLGKQAMLSDLSDDNVAMHMQRLLDDGRSTGTANKERAQLLAIWRYAHRKQLVQSWPCVGELKEPERTPEAWLPEEFDRILKVIEEQKGKFDTVPRSLWWRTFVLLCLDTGERVHAVRSARWDWFSAEWVNFPAEARKGSRRDRAYRLRPETVELLSQIRRLSPVQPFPWTYSDGYIWALFGKILKQAGLPSSRKDKFHKIRKTTGSIAHAAGMDAQQVLDHQHRRTTQRYLDPRFQQSRQVCDVLAEYLANPMKSDRTTRGKIA